MDLNLLLQVGGIFVALKSLDIVANLLRNRWNNKNSKPGSLTIIHDELRKLSKTLQEIRDIVRDHARDAKKPFKKIMEDN